MTEKEFIQFLRVMFQISPKCDLESLLRIIIELEIKACGGKMEYSPLREAQEAF